jgi:uncharacterized protein (TIGR03118 family)
MLRPAARWLAAISIVAVLATGVSAQTTTPYRQTNLVSDLPGTAATTDPNLVNPWGLASSPTSPLWVSDNGSGFATVYNSAGQPVPAGSPLVVTIPPPAGSPAGTTAAPTGAVFNGTTDFVVSQGNASGAAQFLFATEDGTIAGWNSTVNAKNAILAVDNSAGGAVYKGLTLGSNASGNFLYAANFNAGTVDVFDRTFKAAKLAGSFTDPNVPAGFAPFGIQNLGGNIYVTYAKQDAAKHDDVSGAGNGFVSVFDTNGNLIRRVASAGTLNSPWGLALAPSGFGTFSQALLVGNFGDGRINAFNATTGAFLGQLQDTNDSPITIDDLWGLRFGNGGTAGPTTTLFFSAGIQDEQHGLLGTLTVATPGSLPASGEPSVPLLPIAALGILAVGLGLYLRRSNLGLN